MDDDIQEDLFAAAEAHQHELEARRWWDDQAMIEAHQKLRAQLKADIQREHEEFAAWLRGI